MTKVINITCEECDMKFDHERGLRAHKERDHEASKSLITQVDGINKFDVVLEPTYCTIGEECPDEIETFEGISCHVMNVHVTNQVYENYGRFCVDKRRYCIRRNSLSNWKVDFSTSII